MNFFEAQDAARRNTLSLILLFGLAVATLVLITNLLIFEVLAYKETGAFVSSWGELVAVFDAPLFVAVTLAVACIIALGSFYKTAQLSSGGPIVAEMLGGRLIPQSSRDPAERKLLNIVEEMAIASGTPTPAVYLLEESGINAFAAGWSPANAVIGVTRGALTYLSRDELQGVIAHEFSHIFNGDMRLNIRLIGVLNGILLLGMIGYYLMRSVRYVGSSRNRSGGQIAIAIMVLGLGLAVIGYCGTFFGQWIKAIVSRQREYLADASAVQFTRTAGGIAGALKKIGGVHAGSLLLSPSAPEYSHAYFSSGVRSVLSFIFATHPPLAQRIRRIEPRWNGKYVTPKREEAPPQEAPGDKTQTAKHALSPAAAAATVQIAMQEALQAIERAGQPMDTDYAHARQLLQEIPAVIKTEAQDPFGVRALMYSFLIQYGNELQPLQWQHLQAQADAGVYEKTRQLYPAVAALPPALRLPVFELCFPALRALSAPQYQRFKRNVDVLIAADKKVVIGEWIVQRLIKQLVDEAHGLRKPPHALHSHIGAVKKELELILSMVAYTEHRQDPEAHAAFTAGIRAIGATALRIMPREAIAIAAVDNAMDKLEQVKPLLKPRILKALVVCIAVDNQVTIRGAELMRAISGCLGVPMPPLPPLQ